MKIKQHFCKICKKVFLPRTSLQVTCRPTCQAEWDKARRLERSKKLSIRLTGVDNNESRVFIRKKVHDFIEGHLWEKQITIKVKRMKIKTDLSKLKEKADNLWSKAVKERAGNKCEYEKCKTDKYLNSHHIITRWNHATRLLVENGVCLCATHHQFSTEFSAHWTPAKFMEWYIKKVGQEKYDTLVKKSHEFVKMTEGYLQLKIEQLQE